MSFSKGGDGSAMAKQTAVLDIGSSKIICLICGNGENGNIVVHGAGVRSYKGYRDGKFNDEGRLGKAIEDAIISAEDEAKCRIHEIAVGVNAPFTCICINGGGVDVQSKTGLITKKTYTRFLDSSCMFEQPDGYQLMHSTPVDFLIDGEQYWDMPLNMAAKRLEGTVAHIYVQDYFKKLVADSLKKCGITADRYISVPLAQSYFVVPQASPSSDVLIIDTGYTHTDVIYTKNSAFVDFRTIDVGGMQIAGDLAYMFKIPVAAAEQVKRRYVYSLDYGDSIESIRLQNGKLFRVEAAVIQEIIEARTEEIAELINEAVEEMGIRITEVSEVYLTGGGISLMRGGCEFLEQCLGVKLNIKTPWMPRLNSPNYASAFAVMQMAMNTSDDGGEEKKKNGLLDKIKGFFTE